MIEKAVLDNVIETANSRIVDVISDFVVLKRRGANYIGCCPFHDEKTGSFSVSPAKGFYKCFGCGKGGNALTFIMEHEHLTFVESVKFLGNKFGIEVKEKELTPEMMQAKSERESMMAATEFAKDTFAKTLWENDEGQSVGLAYFRHRGFRDDIIKKFELGYSLQKRDAFTQLALQNGFKMEFLTKAGLSIAGENNYKADRFFGRVIFPIHSISGKAVAFGGRVMQTNAKTAKYLNSPESELYHKSDIVYGIFQAKAEIIKQDRCYLVEGYTDVISMHQAGLVNVVASSGTALTHNQIRLIQRFTNNITVLYDGDNAGIKASLRGIDMILSHGMNIKVLLLPDGEDPDSFAQKHSADEYLEYINNNQTDFIKFKTALLMEEAQNDPLKKSALINDIVSSISVVTDKVLRSLYIKECSKLMDIEEQTLFAVLEQLLVKDAVKQRDDKLKHDQTQRQLSEREQAEIEMAQLESGATPTPTSASTDYSSIITRKTNPFAYEEREVLRFLIKYIDQPLFVNTEDATTVGEYIISSLANDEMQSVDPLFNRVIQTCLDIDEKKNLVPEYFINIPDPEMSSLVADLIGTKYVLSKLHSRYSVVVDEVEQLDELVPRVLNQMRMKKIMLTIEDCRNRLKIAESNNASDTEIAAMMDELMLWNEAKKRISSVLGERTVL